MLKAYQCLRERISDLRAVVVLAPSIDPDWVKGVIGDRVPLELINSIEWSRGDAVEQMLRARVGVLKSGTCNLEGAIAGLPFVCVYSGTLFAKIVIAALVALKEYSPVNIIRSNTVKELMRTYLSPQDVVAELEPLLINREDSWNLMSKNLATVRRMLCEPSVDLLSDSRLEGWERLSVSQRVARCILGELG
jgi:lipid A disaccharide synthetase